MQAIPRIQVIKRMRTDNGWWEEKSVSEAFCRMRKRGYFELLFKLVKESEVNRAILLMGPRRVGKTVLIYHLIQELIKAGTSPDRICFVSVDHPIYNGCTLDDFLNMYREIKGIDDKDKVYFFFDEIQYLKEWEVHLKVLVDTNPHIRFLASGSAAAALKLKSQESGAGRFTDFLLPPLTFYEYLELQNLTEQFIEVLPAKGVGGFIQVRNIDEFNSQFMKYLNFGGYPEILFSQEIQSDMERFIKADIIDKVLLRDLPSLYGISDIQELNSLFTTMAFNSANEVSLEGLSQKSGVAKNTIKRYIEYLQAAFLIKVVHRVGHNAKRFQRANQFKVYLANPTMRSALFSPLSENDEEMGNQVETAVFAQWFHSPSPYIHYARWKEGEVDIAYLNPDQKLAWATEIKWSDRCYTATDELKGLISFLKEHKIGQASVTTRTISGNKTLDGINLTFVPASIYCCTVGFNLIRGRHIFMPSLDE